jgi:hypothetical protein
MLGFHVCRTRLFCQALLDTESTEAFAWFFAHYVTMVGGHHPSVCFTDRWVKAEMACQDCMRNIFSFRNHYHYT